MLDFVLEEFDQIVRNCLRGFVGGSIGKRLVLVVGFDNAHDLFGVNWNGRASYPVLDRHDEVGLSVGREIGHCDVVQPLKARQRRVHLDDDLLTLVVQPN